MKTVFLGVFVLSLLLLNSCGFFRSIGMYNVPPDYADTFEEINGIKFIDHPNLTSNIVIELTSTQKVFSPYDSINLTLKITNLSNEDTMYIAPVGLDISYPSYRELVVIDSLGNKQELNIIRVIVCYEGMVDNYSRIVAPTIAPFSLFKFAPSLSKTTELKFQTGKSIFPQLYYNAFSLCREHTPGYYKANYIQNHEEYDKIIGPINTKLISDTVEYYIRNYTEEELVIKSEAKTIIDKIEEQKDLETIDNLIVNHKVKHPNSYYYPGLVKFWEAKKSVEINRKENKIK